MLLVMKISFLLILLSLSIIQNSILSESKIKKCEQRSENDDSVTNGSKELYSCTNKIIVTLTLENN